jgi:hypothetical protein
MLDFSIQMRLYVEILWVVEIEGVDPEPRICTPGSSFHDFDCSEAGLS